MKFTINTRWFLKLLAKWISNFASSKYRMLWAFMEGSTRYRFQEVLVLCVEAWEELFTLKIVHLSFSPKCGFHSCLQNFDRLDITLAVDMSTLYNIYWNYRQHLQNRFVWHFKTAGPPRHLCRPVITSYCPSPSICICHRRAILSLRGWLHITLPRPWAMTHSWRHRVIECITYSFSAVYIYISKYLCFHYPTQKVYTFIASDMSRKVSNTLSYSWKG